MIKFNEIERHVHKALHVANVEQQIKGRHIFNSENISFIIKGSLVGAVIGVLVSLFRKGLDYSLNGLFWIYPYLKAHPIMIPLYVMVTVAIWFIATRIFKPMYENNEKLTWFSSLWRTAIGAMLTIATGIFAGREGPAIKIGLYSAQGFAERLFKENSNNKFLLMNTGMSAGLGAAFSAPVAGTLFLIEAVGIPFSGLLLIASMSASVSAVCATYLFYGLTPCLHASYLSIIPFKLYWVLIILGIVIGIITKLFQSMMNLVKANYHKLPIPAYMTILIPMLLVIPIGLIDPRIIGGSHYFIHGLLTQGFISEFLNVSNLTMIWILLAVMITRFVMTGLSCGATAPTGIFMPILALGAATGALFATISVQYGIIDQSIYINLVVCAMAACFGASLKTPLTAIILIVETIGSIEMVMPLVIVTWVAMIVNNVLKGKSLYSE